MPPGHFSPFGLFVLSGHSGSSETSRSDSSEDIGLTTPVLATNNFHQLYSFMKI
jgi:hypothetical protein